MNAYTYNRTCRCPRCRMHGLMGPAVLITLGILFLLDQFFVLRFHDSFPVLLIVIGLVLYLGRTASMDGHLEPYPPKPPQSTPPPPPGVNPQDQGPEVNR